MFSARNPYRRKGTHFGILCRNSHGDCRDCVVSATAGPSEESNRTIMQLLSSVSGKVCVDWSRHRGVCGAPNGPVTATIEAGSMRYR